MSESQAKPKDTLQLPENEDILGNLEAWTEFSKSYVDNNRDEVQKLAAETINKKVKPGLNEMQQKVFTQHLHFVLQQKDSLASLLKDKKQLELLHQILRCLCLLVQLDQKISQEQKLETMQHIFILLKACAGANGEIESVCLKCMNNFFFSQKSLQEDFVRSEDGKVMKEFLALKDKVSRSALNLYFMVSLALSAKANSLSENVPSAYEISDFVAVAKFAIETLCSICDEIFIVEPVKNDQPKTIASSKHLVYKGENHTLLESGMKLIYGLGATNEEVLKKLEDLSNDALTPEEVAAILSKLDLTGERVPILDKLGFLILRILLAEISYDDKATDKTRAEESLEELQHQCFCVLMFSSKLSTKEQFVGFLLEKGVVKKTVQLMDTIIKKAPSNKSIQNSTNEVIRKRAKRNERMLPILIVLNGFAESNEAAKVELETLLYPFELGEEDYSTMSEEEVQVAKRRRHMSGTTPPNCVGAGLNDLMTSFDQNVKRLSAELVWTICDGQQDKFINRAGYGNGVHLMAIKGGMMQQMMKQQSK